MSFNVLVTITGSTSLGPFQIAECTGYSEEGCTGCTDITNPSGVGITVNELTNGHYVNVTNDNTTSIQLTSSGTCDNVICLLIDGKPTLPPTNTPTATPTGTPTATPTSTSAPTSTPTSTPIPPTSTPTNTPIPPTSTPTPTNTPIPYYSWGFSTPGRSSYSLACNAITFPLTLYTSVNVLDYGVQMYTSPDLDTTVGAGDLWYQYGIDGIAYRINNSGIISEIVVCGAETPTPTPTNTPTPTSTPITGCYQYTVGTTSSSAQYYSFTDCDGIPGDGYIGGVGGYDASTFCAQTNTVSAGGEVTVTTGDPCVVEPTQTPTNTPEPTPTTEPGADGICFGYTYTQYEVTNNLLPEVRYRDMSDTITTSAITGLITVDNNDGTFTGYICVKQGSSYATPVCVDGQLEVSCPNGWSEGSSCSSVTTCAN